MFWKIPNPLKQKQLFVFCISAALFFAFGLGIMKKENRTPSASAAPPKIPKSTKQRTEGEVIALRPTGFEPVEIVREAGPFVLLVNNFSMLPVANLVLERNDGMVLRTVSLLQGDRYWTDTIDLSPGNYTLRESAKHWKCKIVLD